MWNVIYVCDNTGSNWSHPNGKKVLKKNLETIQGKYSVESLQKITHGTSHIIRKALQSETSSLSGGNHRWFKRKSKGKIFPLQA
jgi:hypothetical protein